MAQISDISTGSGVKVGQGICDLRKDRSKELEANVDPIIRIR